jgi:hypothetical protein
MQCHNVVNSNNDDQRLGRGSGGFAIEQRALDCGMWSRGPRILE